MERILITIDKSLLQRIDEYIASIGSGSTRSGFIRDASEYYLRLETGVRGIVRKRELDRLYKDEKV